LLFSKSRSRAALGRPGVRVALLGGALAGVLALSACGGSGSSAAGGSAGGSASGAAASGSGSGGQLTLGTTEPLVSFDPYNGIDQNYVIDHTLYSYLVTYDKNRKPVPDLATSWKFAADNKSVTIQLRKAEFSDGTPVTSADVIAGIKRAQDPATGQTQTGVAKFIASATASGAQAVTVTFKQATAQEAVLDWMFFFPIVEASHNNATYLQTKGAGSGPFMLQSYSPNNQLVLVKNPHYYDPSQPKLQSVTVKFFSDQSSMVSALQFGTLNSAQFVDYNLLAQLQSQFNVVTGSPDAETIIFYLNPTIAPFNVEGCRQAVMRAVDRTAIMKVVQGGEGVAVPGPFTPGSAGYDASLLQSNGFDLTAAKAGIAAHCATKSATAVVQPNPPGTQQSLEIIQKDLASAGFTLNLQPQDSATFVTNLHAGKTQAAMYPTVNPFLSLTALTTNRGFSPLTDNYWWGKTGAPAQYVTAAQQALKAVTPAQVSAAAKAFNTALVDQAWGEGVYTLANHWVLAKNVSGFLTNPADMIELGGTSVG
jgi:peptide/nickel transport system substrate-binding protein